MIGVVDLRMGNLRSVMNAIDAVGHDPKTVAGAADLDDDVTHLVLPGVGSFAVAMSHMHEQGLHQPIRAFASSGRPLLGICLGMQLLASRGTEHGDTPGLDLVAGEVVRFEDAVVPAIPHVGWNELRLGRSHPVFHKVKSGVDFYYVHSYHLRCADPGDVLGVVEYGGRDYTSVVARANVLGMQFHPEKSQANGVRLIENFCDWDGTC
jgi:glutamine amidotransferase